MSQPKARQPVVYFAGSGPGDPDLITVKAKKLLVMADTIVYSGSLLNPKLLECTKKNAMLYDASLIDREKIYEIMRDASWAGQLVMRLHDGDPNIYGATKEQVDKLQADGITCKMIPGVTSLLGAARIFEHGINITWEYSDRNYY